MHPRGRLRWYVGPARGSALPDVSQPPTVDPPPHHSAATCLQPTFLQHTVEGSRDSARCHYGLWTPPASGCKSPVCFCSCGCPAGNARKSRNTPACPQSLVGRQSACGRPHGGDAFRKQLNPVWFPVFAGCRATAGMQFEISPGGTARRSTAGGPRHPAAGVPLTWQACLRRPAPVTPGCVRTTREHA